MAEPMKVLSLKVPERMVRELEGAAKRRRISRSRVIREAVDAYLTGPKVARPASILDSMGDLVGCVRDAPADLSTNPAYLDSLGK